MIVANVFDEQFWYNYFDIFIICMKLSSNMMKNFFHRGQKKKRISLIINIKALFKTILILLEVENVDIYIFKSSFTKFSLERTQKTCRIKKLP